ncbi:MAG: DUF2017 family protein [Acidimicrobiales bacterium]|jgi:hypothetical protein
MAFASLFRRRRDGRYTVRLDHNLRVVLVSVAQQLGPMIDAGDKATTRLFPPAYTGEDTAQQEQEYRTLVDGALRNHHHRALDTLINTAHADTLSAEELDAWLSAIGTMRLVLGTRLDVIEDMEPPEPGDPAGDEFVLYDLLGTVQANIIEVLASQLPDEGTPERAL